MSDQIIPPVSAIDQDTLCAHCGYNLRGLLPDGQCPECGQDVALSLHGNLLQYADAYWLDRLRFGVKLKLWNIVLGFIAGVILAIAKGVTGAIFPITLLTFASTGLGLWATFLITMQEPRILLTEDSVTLRKFVRGCAMFSVFGGLMSYSRDAQSFVILFAIVTWIATLAGYATTICELIYLRRFAIRVPDEKLALSTKRLMWASIVSFALIIVAGVLAVFLLGTIAPGASSGAGANGIILTGLGCFTVVAVLVLFIWYVRLLMKYKDAFEVASGLSRGDVSVEPVLHD